MNYVLWILILFLFLYIIRAIKGPSIWDQLLAMSVISTKIIVIIIVFASIHETAFFLDFAIIYALFGFIGTILIALFLSERGGRGKE